MAVDAANDRILGKANVKRFSKTPEYVKARAMQLYGEYGLDEASRRMGVNKTTMNRWRKELGIPSRKLQPVTVQDIDLALREQDMLRLDVQSLLINKTRLLLHMMTEDKKGEELFHLARATGTLIDKYRMEQGQATSRSETTVVDEEFTERERMVLMRNISAELASRARRAASETSDGTPRLLSEGPAEGTLQVVQGSSS